MYDIACRPELVKKLRAEIESVVGECDGVMSTQALYKMRLLDSVMKESQRVNPLGFGRSPLASSYPSENTQLTPRDSRIPTPDYQRHNTLRWNVHTA